MNAKSGQKLAGVMKGGCCSFAVLRNEEYYTGRFPKSKQSFGNYKPFPLMAILVC